MNWERQRTYDLEEGFERGFKHGEHNKAIEAARNLIKMNIGTYEQIAQAQGLPLEEVQNLAEELKQTVIS